MSNGNDNKDFNALQFGTNLLDLAGGYYIGKEGTEQALSIGEQGFSEAKALAGDVAGMAEFKPFTVTTGLGTATTTPEGGYTLTMTPEQQALQTSGLTSAQGFMTGIGQDALSNYLATQAESAYRGLSDSSLTGLGTTAYSGLGPSSLRTTGGTGLSAVGADPMQAEILKQARAKFAGLGADTRQQALLTQSDLALARAGVDPSLAQADLYEQIRATQRPEEERQRLALEERMLSQGRLGLSSSAYGGSTPEMLAQETARQEAMSRANLSARQQAMQEQQQSYGQGLGLLGQASGLRAQDLAEATGLLGAGYTPEQRELARAQAQLSGGLSQEQADLTRAGALFGAGMTEEQADFARAGALQQASYIPRAQDLAMAQGMLGLGYTPQSQALEALRIGTGVAGLADIGRRSGAEFYGQAGLGGIEALMQGLSEASGYDLAMKRGLLDTTSGMLSGGLDSDLSADSWGDMSDFERAMALKNLYDKYKDTKGDN